MSVGECGPEFPPPPPVAAVAVVDDAIDDEGTGIAADGLRLEDLAKGCGEEAVEEVVEERPAEPLLGLCLLGGDEPTCWSSSWCC